MSPDRINGIDRPLKLLSTTQSFVKKKTEIINNLSIFSYYDWTHYVIYNYAKENSDNFVLLPVLKFVKR